MVGVEKKEMAVTLIAFLFMCLYSLGSLYGLDKNEYDPFDIFRILGVSCLFLAMAFTPKIFFVPLKNAFDPDLPTILLSRKTVSVLALIAYAMLAIGFIGGWVF